MAFKPLGSYRISMPVRLALAALLLSGAAHAEGPAPAQVSTCFTPGPVRCAEVIADTIDAAQATVRVQAYWFMSEPELRALAAAKARGLDVQVIVKELPGNPRAGGFGAAPLAKVGITVWVDPAPISTDSKVLILDASTVITSRTKIRPATDDRQSAANVFDILQNVTLLRSAEVAGWYGRAWDARRAVSQVFGIE